MSTSNPKPLSSPRGLRETDTPPAYDRKAGEERKKLIQQYREQEQRNQELREQEYEEERRTHEENYNRYKIEADKLMEAQSAQENAAKAYNEIREKYNNAQSDEERTALEPELLRREEEYNNSSKALEIQAKRYNTALDVAKKTGVVDKMAKGVSYVASRLSSIKKDIQEKRAESPKSDSVEYTYEDTNQHNPVLASSEDNRLLTVQKTDNDLLTSQSQNQGQPLLENKPSVTNGLATLLAPGLATGNYLVQNSPLNRDNINAGGLALRTALLSPSSPANNLLSVLTTPGRIAGEISQNLPLDKVTSSLGFFTSTMHIGSSIIPMGLGMVAGRKIYQAYSENKDKIDTAGFVAGTALSQALPMKEAVSVLTTPGRIAGNAAKEAIPRLEAGALTAGTVLSQALPMKEAVSVLTTPGRIAGNTAKEVIPRLETGDLTAGTVLSQALPMEKAISAFTAPGRIAGNTAKEVFPVMKTSALASGTVLSQALPMKEAVSTLTTPGRIAGNAAKEVIPDVGTEAVNAIRKIQQPPNPEEDAEKQAETMRNTANLLISAGKGLEDTDKSGLSSLLINVGNQQIQDIPYYTQGMRVSVSNGLSIENTPSPLSLSLMGISLGGLFGVATKSNLFVEGFGNPFYAFRKTQKIDIVDVTPTATVTGGGRVNSNVVTTTPINTPKKSADSLLTLNPPEYNPTQKTGEIDIAQDTYDEFYKSWEIVKKGRNPGRERISQRRENILTSTNPTPTTQSNKLRRIVSSPAVTTQLDYQVASRVKTETKKNTQYLNAEITPEINHREYIKKTPFSDINKNPYEEININRNSNVNRNLHAFGYNSNFDFEFKRKNFRIPDFDFSFEKKSRSKKPKIQNNDDFYYVRNWLPSPKDLFKSQTKTKKSKNKAKPKKSNLLKSTKGGKKDRSLLGL